MVLTEDVILPSEEELTVPEVNLSGSILKAGAFHLGKACEFENNEFVLCRTELGDPRKCLDEGKAVTNCALGFFGAVKTSCADDFLQHANCLDKSSSDQSFTPCRQTQAAFDNCMKDKLNIERPPSDYYARVQVHKADRPRPAVEKPKHFEDPTPYLPDDAEKPPAKYGSRYLHLW